MVILRVKLLFEHLHVLRSTVFLYICFFILAWYFYPTEWSLFNTEFRAYKGNLLCVFFSHATRTFNHLISSIMLIIKTMYLRSKLS